MAAGDAVANEPRLFVGQIPAECTEEDLWPLFSPFGTVRNLHILRGPDSKPRGCAMVLFARWAQAEAAAEALDGTAALTGSQGRPLVVHFANPRKPPPGQLAEPGLAPRKLFVGQVPRDVTEDLLRPFFEPYGDIEHINILRTQRGQSAGCGFVQFRKWAQAELAMEAHNGKTRLGGGEVPLVVKFADAKRREQLGLGGLPGLPGLKPPRGGAFLGGGMSDPADYGLYQLGQQLGQQQWPAGLLAGSNPMLGGQLALQQGMQSLMAGGYGPYGAGQYMLPADPAGLVQLGLRGGASSDRLGGEQLGAKLAAGSPQRGAEGGLGGPLLAGAATSLGLSQTAPISQALAGLPGSDGGAALAAQLGELELGALGRQQAGSEGSSSTPFLRGQAAAASASLPDLAPMLGGGPVPQAVLPSLGSNPADALLPGGMAFRPDMAGLYLAGMQPGGGGMGLPGLGGPEDLAPRPWGQKISGNDRHNEWKLFIGQVPLEAGEEDLWQLFAPIGQILELYVLRNNNAKSRGCAFITFATKQLAEVAITQLNGRPMPTGKQLVVKFADRAFTAKPPPPPPAAGPLGLYM